jgi:regulator of protease activity HflC (stomatin/prohibitin superfamily)
MKTLNRICAIVCAVIIAALLLHKLLLIEVPLGKVGVLTQQYAMPGAARGVKAHDYRPGWHLDLGPIHSWTLFDTTMQTIEMSSHTPNSAAVQLKSSDGYSISLDITIKYKIQPEKVHLHYQAVGGREANTVSLVRNEANDTFRDIFGGMRTEDFYNPRVRREKTALARVQLASRLDSRFVQLADILIRDIGFDPQYEKKIMDKKLADQDVELNKSQSLAAEKKGETNVIEAGADAMVKVIDREREGELLKMRAETEKAISELNAEAQKYATQARADADLYAAQLIAASTLKVREAEAEGERLKAAALQGAGGANLVALECMRNLLLGDMILSTVDLDVLDLERMAQKLGARAQ